MVKCGWVGPCVVGLVGQVGAGHLTHPSPHLPHFVLLGFRKRCWFGKNGTIWMNKRCKEGENGVDEKEKVEKLGQKNMLEEKWCKNWVGGRGCCWWIEVLDAFRHLPILTFISCAQTNNLGILSLPVPINTFPCPSIFSFWVVHQSIPFPIRFTAHFHCSLTLSSSLAMSLFPSDYLSINMLI